MCETRNGSCVICLELCPHRSFRTEEWEVGLMMYFYPRVSPEFSDMESENGGPSPGRGGFFFETMILRLHDHLWGVVLM